MIGSASEGYVMLDQFTNTFKPGHQVADLLLGIEAKESVMKLYPHTGGALLRSLHGQAVEEPVVLGVPD